MIWLRQRKKKDPAFHARYNAAAVVRMQRYRNSAKGQATAEHSRARLYNTFNILREDGWKI